jgi:outer membrane assembly lipoprotein YfiO
MRSWTWRCWLIFACVALLPARLPAPLIYTPGEGWRYEKFGEEGKWIRGRAEDQLRIAQEAFDKKDYGLSLKAARRTVSRWPYSDFAPKAQYLVGRSYEAKKQDEKAFKAYQRLVERYPKIDNYEEVTRRQFEIANRFLQGQRFKAFGTVPLFASMDKTIKMYEQIIKAGTYSPVAAQAQMNIGVANEKRKTLFAKTPNYPEAAKAYEKAADRYAGEPIGTDAFYRVGDTYAKQARRAEYDQSVAGTAIASFSDFSTLHPDDPRVPQAQKQIDMLKTEQARGSFAVARFYEKRNRPEAAKIYYNDVLLKDPGSTYADDARRRIDAIVKKAK